MKKLFATPFRIVCTSIGLILALALLAGAVWIIVVHTAFVDQAQATETALADAGLTQADVSGLRTKLEHDDGRFVYEVDFYHQGTEYDYTIAAASGELVGRDIDGDVPGSAQNQTTTAATAAPAVTNATPDTTQPPQTTTQAAVGGGILTEDEAKAAALADAGLAAEAVTFLSVQLETDDGVQVYDISFYTDQREYDYEIYAADGRVKERSSDQFFIVNDQGEGYIGVDRAKEIALTHANLAADQVQFTKAKLENDDGITEYEISFYYGNLEYDYTIHADTGEILEYDTERG